MNRCRPRPTKYLSGEKIHADNNNKLFKNLDHVNSSLYGVEFARAQAEKGAISCRVLHSSNFEKMSAATLLQFFHQIV